ncbi:MAG: gamma carbonic anhydrase family protein [Candidatus Kapabacteria bacterium]|nr:gamma carbonic anhydrase family protein [Candidatus Kapabacteria bacterium]
MKLESGHSGSIIGFKGVFPKIHPSVFICEGVRIIGDVEIGEGSSVWYNCVIRGDVHYIKIGKNVNIQDMSMIHVTNDKFPVNIADNVSLAHSVSVHGATLNEGCLIGIGAIVLDGAVVGKNSLVAAGALVREGFVVPDGTMVAGVPAKVIKELNADEIYRVTSTTSHYKKYIEEYRKSYEL